MKKKLVKDKNGLLTINIKPNEKILRKLYKDEYYQKTISQTYKKKYSRHEIKYNELSFKLSKLFFKKKHKFVCFSVFI